MRRVAIATLGCKVNQYDSEGLAERFRQAGYEVVGFGEPADVYVVNTCTVTQTGDKKSRQLLRRAVGAHPDALVVATGCYAQSSPEDLVRIEGVALVSGTADRGAIVDRVNELLEEGYSNRPSWNTVGDIESCRVYEELPAHGCAERTRAYVKIEDGCENFCAYCRVPYVRGPVRSRPLHQIVAEVQQIALAGHREVVLTGIDLGAYGRDFDGRPDLSDALRACAEVPGISRVRVSSIDPRDVTDRLIQAMSGTVGVCPHLHIPLQSGSARVLAAMNRNYTPEYYLDVVERARLAIPDLAVTTDVIVGFPGETEEDFNATMETSRAARFSRMHVFPYSRRPGTVAAQMSGQVARSVKEARCARLIALARELAQEFHESMVGSTVSVLVEQCEPGEIQGLTGNYARVVAKGSGCAGETVDVKVTRAEEGYVQGDAEL